MNDLHAVSTPATTRRRLLAGGAAAAATLGFPLAAAAADPSAASPPAARRSSNHPTERRTMSTFTTKDGTQIYYKDWGSGPAVSFSHGWPLSSDAWESQMFHLASNGFRCIAHDRRGHGRSSQPWHGNNMDTYADDLNELFTALDVRGVTMIGHSTGGGEVARYIGRHGSRRVARAVLMGAVTPIMLKSPNNPVGLPMEVFDGFRKAYLADRAQFFHDVASGPFFNFNRPGAKISQGLIQSWVSQGLMSGHKNADVDHPRRRRPARADRRLGAAGGQAGQELGAEGLPGRLAQPGRHPQGKAQRRPAGLRAILSARGGATPRPPPSAIRNEESSPCRT
jgi:non-heme chloroperoxidase